MVNRRDAKHCGATTSWSGWLAAAGILMVLAGSTNQPGLSTTSAAQEDATDGARRTVRLIPIPLPIAGSVDLDVIRSTDKLLSELPSGGERPILIFEFRAKPGQAGEGSHFERALSLARFLASDRFRRVRTVAFVPTSVRGHAVLPVLACEEIIIHPDAELGDAGIDESVIDPTMRRAYTEMAERRRTIPPSVVLGMLDRDIQVTQVQLIGGGTQFVLDEQLEELRREGKIARETTLIPAGDMGRFPGSDLRGQFGFASHLARDTRQLAEALQVPAESIEAQTAAGQSWQGFRVDLTGHIDGASANEVQRAILSKTGDGSHNFVCLYIDSPGGPPDDALRLASYLASLDSSKIRTVAYVSGEARSVAGMIALACDEVVAEEQALLGGPGDTHIRNRIKDDLKTAVQQLAESKQRSWSMMLAMADPQLKIFRYRREGGGDVLYLCEEEFEDLNNRQQWTREAELDVSDGITAEQAKELFLVRDVVSNYDQFLQLYNFPAELDTVDRGWPVAALERLAAAPWFGRTLLFIAFFALITEASAPGIGIAGFVSGLCFLLFFWCQFLNGTAGWLEVLLFVGGVGCILLEILVLPGFGVFGVGGLLMILTSLVLATQTFVFPHNAYQMNQVPSSMWTIAASGAGILVSMWIVRKYLPDAPILNRMMLAPPDEDELEERRHREALVKWDYLVGKQGLTTTQLTPSGKARFGDDVLDVISDGELIARGTKVYVADVIGSRIVVQAVNDDATPSSEGGL